MPTPQHWAWHNGQQPQMNAQGTQSRAPDPVCCTALHTRGHHTRAHTCTQVHTQALHTQAPHMCAHVHTRAHMRVPHMCTCVHAHTCAHARARGPEITNAVLRETVHEPSLQQPEQGFGVPPPGHHGVSFTPSRCPLSPMWPDSLSHGFCLVLGSLACGTENPQGPPGLLDTRYLPEMSLPRVGWPCPLGPAP